MIERTTLPESDDESKIAGVRAMISTPSTVSVPLRNENDGTIRIGETRVLLEIVIHAFQRGATPEGILESFPTLKLEDVYAVIAYYLQNRAAVDEYVRQAEEEGERIRREIEAKLNPPFAKPPPATPTAPAGR